MSDGKKPDEKKRILVVGGGISGITTAVEAAEAGYSVTLVEKNPYLGGRVAQLTRYFPKLCPPYCGLEINFRRLKRNALVDYYTMAQVESVSGSEGNFQVKIKQSPRMVNDKCTVCNKCVEVCPQERLNDFNFGLDKNKAVYLPHNLAFPMKYVIDSKVCKGSACGKCKEVCKYDAIDLDMKETNIEINCASIVFATGWSPYDASKMENLGYGKVKNVITNMMMERYASNSGPTAGKITRPSDGKTIESIAFVQCAGSRDENHLGYCSAVCCMATLKQASYIREQYPDAQIFIYYIDLRAPGKYEAFLNKSQADDKIKMIKGKVAKIEQDKSGGVIVTAEDIEGGGKIHQTVDMVVLATGMEPALKGSGLNVDVKYQEDGFVAAVGQTSGIYAAGVAKRPSDVTTSLQDATAMALKGIQSLVGR